MFMVPVFFISKHTAKPIAYWLLFRLDDTKNVLNTYTEVKIYYVWLAEYAVSRKC